jgi:peptidoglycan-associated lipoprotein
MSKRIIKVRHVAPVLFLAACSSAPPAAPKTPASVPPETQLGAKSATQAQVRIAEDIRRACGIPEADAHFAFDSANVQQTERRVLSMLADCFVSGPLAGRAMRLVGHADPRGDAEYNFVLGGRRADNVKTFLIQEGMRRDRVASTSRGEIEADGQDEATWREDRRVDVLLAQ